MSVGKSNEDEIRSAVKDSNSLVVRINHDSDDNLQALFDSVLNPGESKRPLQVPFRMRQLPESFFKPPAASARSPSVTHSRANSADSAYDAGSQPNVNQTTVASPPTTTAMPVAQVSPNGLAICHSRAHSSPASLQQTYNIQMNSMISDSGRCVQEGTAPNFSANVGFASGISTSGTVGIDRLSQCASQDTTSSIQTFHMKQRSYDVVSPIQLQNELGVLPSGWEQAKTNDGQIYYLNHTTKTTQWEDPRVQMKQQRVLHETLSRAVNVKNAKRESLALTESLGPLPEGWEQALTDSGDIYFINHINRTTSWNDPRIPDFLQKSVKAPKSEMAWSSVNQPEKDQDFFKQKSEQSALTRQSAGLQMDPFLSGDNHARQESSDSGLSLSSNTFTVNGEYMPQIDDSMDCISESGSLNTLSGIDCPDNLVSSLQLEDNICSEMFSDVHRILNPSSTKQDNLEWYKIN